MPIRTWIGAAWRRPPLRIILASLWFGLLSLPLMVDGQAPLLGLRGPMLVGALVGFVGLLRWLASAWGPSAGARVSRLTEAGAGAVRRAVERVDRRLLYALAIAAAALIPLGLNRYFIDVLTQVGIYVMLALGLNIVVGLAGLLDLGYVAFYAVGAYAYGLLSTRVGLSFWEVLPLGALLAALFGVLLGVPVLRLKGDYLAIVTLGFGEMIRITLNNWDSLTRGPNGIIGIARPRIFGFVFSRPIHYYYLILAIVILTIFVVDRLNRSRIGRAWTAMRDDELAAEAMGVNLMHAKLLAFALGALWAGVAGVFFAAKMTFISPESFTFFESVIILCMVVLGGMGSVPGVILGAALLVILPEFMRQFALYRMLIFGGAMVTMMVLRPQGFLGSRRRAMASRVEDAPPQRPVAASAPRARETGR
jgi:branched-chain amino acid transport system permease protein